MDAPEAAAGVVAGAVPPPGQAVDGAVNHAPPPSLTEMPDEVLDHIFQYISWDEHDGLTTLLSLERTCRSLRDLLSGDGLWTKHFPFAQNMEYEHATTARERVYIMKSIRNIRIWKAGGLLSSDNIVLRFLGGADGVRRVVGKLLERMRVNPFVGDGPPPWRRKIVLRGDTIDYLTELLQDHIVTKLQKAYRLTLDGLRAGDHYPQLSERNLRMLDMLLLADGDGTLQHCSLFYDPQGQECHTCHSICIIGEGSTWKWPDDNCCGEEVLGDRERTHLVRALGYRAGIVKISGKVFPRIAAEILHHVGVMVAYASEESTKKRPVLEMTSDDETRRDMSYYAENCPPPLTDDEGRVECVIVPRQIKEAAVKNGMNPLLGYGEFGAQWAPCNIGSKEDEIEEAIARYGVGDPFNGRMVDIDQWRMVDVDSQSWKSSDESMSSGSMSSGGNDDDRIGGIGSEVVVRF